MVVSAIASWQPLRQAFHKSRKNNAADAEAICDVTAADHEFRRNENDEQQAAFINFGLANFQSVSERKSSMQYEAVCPNPAS